MDQSGSSWHGREKREKAHTSSPDPFPWWILLSPDYLQAPQLSHWIFLHRRQSLWKYHFCWPSHRLKFVTLKRRETHMADGEAVPAEVLGLFHSLLAQAKPGSSSLQAGRCEHCGRGQSTLESPGVEVAEPEEQRWPCEATGRWTLLSFHFHSCMS